MLHTNTAELFNKKIFILVFVLLIALFAPFFMGVFAIFSYLTTKRAEWLYVFFISLILLFCNMNLYKEVWSFGDFLGIGNDLGWYSTQWFAFNNYPHGFLSIFDDGYVIFINDGLLVQPKASEPIYHGFSYFFSKLTNGNYIFYTYTVTLFIYLPACIIIFKILESAKFSELLIALVLVFFVFYSMKFTNMFNMIRHYCSGSFLLITLYFIYFDKLRWAVFFAIIASLTHNAAAVISVLYFVVYYVTKHPQRTNSYKIFSVLVSASILSIVYLLVYYATFTNYEELDDRGSGIVFKLADVTIVLVAIFAYKYRHNTVFDKLWFYYLAIIVLTTFMHLTNFLQLRYYAYFDYFRWIGLVYIFSFLLRFIKLKLLFFTTSFVLFTLFLWFRIYISDFDFNGLFHNYFFIKI